MQPENDSRPPQPQTETPKPVYGGNAQPTTSFSQATVGNKKKKLFIGIVALAVLLLGTSAGAFFGIYLPNKPENVWNKALDNTATGYDKLVDYADEQKGSKGGTLKGNFKLDADQLVVDGNIDTKYSEKTSVTKLDAGASGTRINLDLLTNKPENASSPDVYLRLNGLKGIDQLLGGGAGLGSALASFDNQWYVVDHTFFDQLAKEASKSDGETKLPSINQEDITDITKKVGEVNRQYLFTDDSDKAVFKRTQNIGKEKLDGRNAYHYKVGYDREHLKAYLNALKDEMNKTKLKGYFGDSEVNNIISSVEKLDGKGEADAWVDLKTKLVRKVRFAEQNNTDSYVDVGLRYNGGDEYPFFVDFAEKNSTSESKGSVNFNLNTKANNIKFGVNADVKSSGTPYKFTLDSTLTPGNQNVEFSKPENVKSLLEAFSQLTGGQTPQGLLQQGAPAANSVQ